MGRLKLKQDKSEPLITMPSPPYRPNTQRKRLKFGFVYNNGGLGDYIHWTTAIQYAIETQPQLYGYILVRPFFRELARHWLRPYLNRFEIIATEDPARAKEIDGVLCHLPNSKQYANANTHHLFSLGFIFYAERSTVPEGWLKLPEIRGDECNVNHFNLPENYAVIPVAATAENRRLPAETINAIAEHLSGKGITPVFLGKREICPDYFSHSPGGIKTDNVYDLREKTNLLQAAVIMARARLTVGLDGGLLHLASCSTAPVIFAFTSVDPTLRLPPRPTNAKTLVITPPETLPCRFCNSRMKSMYGHDFANCLYKDNACVTALSPDQFISYIDKLIE